MSVYCSSSSSSSSYLFRYRLSPETFGYTLICVCVCSALTFINSERSLRSLVRYFIRFSELAAKLYRSLYVMTISFSGRALLCSVS